MQKLKIVSTAAMFLSNSSFTVYLLISIVLLLLFIKTCLKLSAGRCNSNTCLVGKTCLITDANSGNYYLISIVFLALYMLMYLSI